MLILFQMVYYFRKKKINNKRNSELKIQHPGRTSTTNMSTTVVILSSIKYFL